MTIIDTSTRVAGKEHKCNFCNQPILKGERYRYQALIYDGFYTWKNHLSCGELASRLRWYDDCDEGLTGDSFKECVRCEYSNVMSKYFNDKYESNDFKVPEWKDQLTFILIFHKILKP